MSDESGTQPLLECDLVMKGGITSGVIYPGAVVGLSERYRFRQIGGASAGAIAATLAAAAEHGRQTALGNGGDSHESFRRLGEIPVQLGEQLAGLFQPSQATKPIFDVMMALLKPAPQHAGKPAEPYPKRWWSGIAAKVRAVIASGMALVRKARGPANAVAIAIARLGKVFVLATLGWWIPGVLFTLIVVSQPLDGFGGWRSIVSLGLSLTAAVVLATLTTVIVLITRSLKAIEENGFGVCNGHTGMGTTPPLTDWIEERLRWLALRENDPRPVTFGDLWGAEAVDAYRHEFLVTSKDGTQRFAFDQSENDRLSAADRRRLSGLRTTDCLVMTTDLSHGRPYRFPFETQSFAWCERCLADYFPTNVIEAMRAGATPVPVISVGARGAPRSLQPECPRHVGSPLYYMPLAPDIPLVIAARISLSFPGLISAVPLHAIDWSRAFDKRSWVTVWFSDGGIASNFPIRFFDSMWPRRPTFGINLAPEHPDFRTTMVYRPHRGMGAYHLRHRNITTVGSFLGALRNAMQNWNDATQATMPGFRDRIVEVRQGEGEGGINLNMDAQTIENLSRRGQMAAHNLLGTAAPDADGTISEAFDFEHHRWVRYRTAMSGLDDMLAAMHSAWDSQEAFLETREPTRSPYAATKSDLEATRRVMALADELAALGNAHNDGTVPRPLAAAKLVPPI